MFEYLMPPVMRAPVGFGVGADENRLVRCPQQEYSATMEFPMGHFEFLHYNARDSGK